MKGREAVTAASLIIVFCLSGGSDAVVVDGHRQLFLDDYLVASSDNVARRVHQARKHPGNPVLRGGKTWEREMAILYGSVLREGGKYRAWYHSGGGGVGYAESADGIVWTKPRLGIVYLDEENTNLVIRRGAAEGEAGAIRYFYELFGVFRDEHDPDPLRRYKMGFLSIHRDYRGPHEDPFHRGQRRGLGVAASPDGIHWRLVENWATDAICDGATHWMFNPAAKKYVLYGRTKHKDPEVVRAWGGNEWVGKYFWGRSVARVQSADFLQWEITRPGKAPVVMSADARDPPGTEIYSMLVFPYESAFIGLVQVFYNRPDACHLDIQLAVSRDSVHFTRVGRREPFIPVGPVGSWDRFNNSLANNPPIPSGDTLRFYYGGRTYRHGPYAGKDKGQPGGCIGLATIKRDRFVSLGASFDGGKIVTRPLKLKGGTLHLNAKSDFGQVVVEVLDAGGEPVARSKPIRRDALDIPVEWERGSLPDPRKPVVLRITLRNALLFALWCS